MSFLTLASSRGPTVCFRLCTRFALRAAMQTGMTETGASFRELSKWWERQVGKAAPAGQPLPQVSPINALLLFLGDSESSLSPMETNVLDKFPSLTENTLKKKKGRKSKHSVQERHWRKQVRFLPVHPSSLETFRKIIGWTAANPALCTYSSFFPKQKLGSPTSVRLWKVLVGGVDGRQWRKRII